MNIKQLSIFVENRAGRLAEITTLMAEKEINIRAFSIADTKDFGILRLIVDNPDHAVEVLREGGNMVSITNVIAVHMRNKPGELANIMQVIAKAGLDIDYMYAFVTEQAGGAYTVLRVEDEEKVVEVLTGAGHVLATAQELQGA